MRCGKARGGLGWLGEAGHDRRGAIQLLHAHDPVTGAWLWVAASRSTPGLGYVLREGRDGRWVCSCPAARYRDVCAHQAALYALLRPGGSQGAILSAGKK